MEHFLSLTQGLGLFLGIFLATGAFGTFVLVGLARLEMAAAAAQPPSRRTARAARGAVGRPTERCYGRHTAPRAAAVSAR